MIIKITKSVIEIYNLWTFIKLKDSFLVFTDLNYDNSRTIVCGFHIFKDKNVTALYNSSTFNDYQDVILVFNDVFMTILYSLRSQEILRIIKMF